MSIRINVTSVFVDDQAKALAFYTDKLGFHLIRGGPDEDNISIGRGDATLMLEAASGDFYASAYNEAIRERLNGKSPNALYMEAEDLDELYAKVQAEGVRVIDPIAARHWGQTEFTVEDPAGNWLTFWSSPAK